MLRLTRAAEIARAKTLNGTSPMSALCRCRRGSPGRQVRSRCLVPGATDRPRTPASIRAGTCRRIRKRRCRTPCPLRGGGKGQGRQPRTPTPRDARRAPQALEAALRVGEHNVVLRRIGAMVVVETSVHATELGQAHRHVAVVEDHRHAEPLAETRRDPEKVRHRHGEEHDGVHVPLALEQLLEMAQPPRRHVAPDHVANRLVEARVIGVVLGTAKVAVALQPGNGVTGPRERLGLVVERVRRDAPPRGLDRPTPVRRHDQVDAYRMQSLPELPPGRRAAVAEVEVDRRGDREDLRRLNTHLVERAPREPSWRGC